MYLCDRMYSCLFYFNCHKSLRLKSARRCAVKSEYKNKFKLKFHVTCNIKNIPTYDTTAPLMRADYRVMPI